MISPTAKQDKVVRQTDLDALSSRHSASERGYFSLPDYYGEDLIRSYQHNLQFTTGYTAMSAGRTVRAAFGDRKLPIINRGTFLRTRAIDEVVDRFINYHNGTCQVISLGGGSDTRGFRLLAEHCNVIYHEIDFPDSVKIKKLAILDNDSLRKVIGVKEEGTHPNTREEFEAYDSDIHTERYHLVGEDLRQLHDYQWGNSELATLIISECVLCYVDPNETTQILKMWTKQIQGPVAVVIYEPLSLNDAFGETMAHNLASRGINLSSFTQYPTLASRRAFLAKECGLEHVRITDIAQIGGYAGPKAWISTKELNRVNSLELVDEIEEITMLYQHYCVCFGEVRGDFGTTLDDLTWN
ncbi:leucine carboxyl methyltransferase 1 [Diutina catenulata]